MACGPVDQESEFLQHWRCRRQRRLEELMAPILGAERGLMDLGRQGSHPEKPCDRRRQVRVLGGLAWRKDVPELLRPMSPKVLVGLIVAQ